MLIDLLATKVFVPALDLMRGSQIGLYRNNVRAVVDSDLPTIREMQLGRIRTICQQAYDSTKFYRDRFDQIGLRNFSELTLEEFGRIPVLTKSELREKGDSLLSSAFQASDLRRSATGGTTASPTAYYIDWPANDRRWAATHEFDRRIGYERGQKIAYLWGATQDFENQPSWKQRLQNTVAVRSKYLPSSPLDPVRMAEYFHILKKWRPAFLQAYPTALAIFADYLLSNDLELEIPAISVTAEPLSPSQREVISRVFGCQPFNWYGAREAGRIATECKHHDGLHINAYGLHVEIEGAGGYHNSDIGSIVITDLWNAGMPIIRYEIGDLGSLTDEPCACGSQLPRIVELVGRTTDVFFNSRGQRIPGVAFTNRVVKDDLEFREMQFIQRSIGQFQVLVVPGRNWQGRSSEAMIRDRISEFMQEPTEASVMIVDTIPREPSGKLRLCKNLMSL